MLSTTVAFNSEIVLFSIRFAHENFFVTEQEEKIRKYTSVIWSVKFNIQLSFIIILLFPKCFQFIILTYLLQHQIQLNVANPFTLRLATFWRLSEERMFVDRSSHG